METLTLIGTIVGIATFMVLVGGGFFWWGRMSYRVDYLARDVQSLQDDVQTLRGEVKAAREEQKADMTALREEQKADMAALREEQKADMAALREEQKADMAALRNEIRRSEQRILAALANHSHVAPDAGQPVFRFPPGMEVPEPVAADGAPAEA